MEAKEFFRKLYSGQRNFMTPKIKGYGKLNRRFAYEFSYGSGMTGNTIYGVTVLGVSSKGEIFKCPKLSQCCHNLNDAKRYIQRLKYKLSKKEYK